MTYYNPPHEEITYSQAHVLIDIERLVESIIDSDTEGTILLRDEHRISIYSDYYVAALLEQLPDYLIVYSPFHDYSEHIKIFWAGCFESGIIVQGFGNASTHYSIELSSIEQVRYLIAYLVEHGKSPEFMRKIIKQVNALQACYQVIQSYDQSLHSQYPDLVTFRFDLGYHPNHQHAIKIESIYKHINAFLRLSTSRSGYLEHLVGNYRVIVQCEERGYHIHAVFYYEKSKLKKNWNYCHEIGELWMFATSYIGTFTVCNVPRLEDHLLGLQKLNIPHDYDSLNSLNGLHDVGYPTQHNHVFSHLRMWPHGSRVIVTGHEEY